MEGQNEWIERMNGKDYATKNFLNDEDPLSNVKFDLKTDMQMPERGKESI